MTAVMVSNLDFIDTDSFVVVVGSELFGGHSGHLFELAAQLGGAAVSQLIGHLAYRELVVADQLLGVLDALAHTVAFDGYAPNLAEQLAEGAVFLVDPVAQVFRQLLLMVVIMNPLDHAGTDFLNQLGLGVVEQLEAYGVQSAADLFPPGSIKIFFDDGEA